MKQAEIGIIGGSGLYSLLSEAQEVKVSTKYGNPSDTISVGELAGKTVAFLPRHGKTHKIPPHKVPYRANIDALHQLGVKRIIATNAVGSLKADYKPGELALYDQFVNLTHGRVDTFYDGDVVAHVSTAEPYCPQLRSLALKASKAAAMPMHESGTIVVINGPRFSTKAESRIFSSQGSHMIGMTQYPEITLAKELQICYLGVGLVTDYDAGLEGREDIKAVSFEDVSKTFAANVDKAKRLITDTVSMMPDEFTCECQSSMKSAIIKH